MKELVLLSLLLTTNPALAQPSQPPSSGTFADLAYQCSYRAPEHPDGLANILDAAHSDGYARGYCFGVLSTAIDLLNDSGDIQTMGSDFSFDKARQVIKDYLRNHPEESNKQAAIPLRAALRQAWPRRR